MESPVEPIRNAAVKQPNFAPCERLSDGNIVVVTDRDGVAWRIHASSGVATKIEFR